MINPENYKFYRVRGESALSLIAKALEADKAHMAILTKMMESSGCVGYRSYNHLGQTIVSDLAFPLSFPVPPDVKVRERSTLLGEEVVILVGDGRRKDGKIFNAKIRGVIDAANQMLGKQPNFSSYLIDALNIKCSTLGRATAGQRGVPLISTFGGLAHGSDDTLLFAIPQVLPGNNDRQPDVPALLEEITYGVFYDLSHSEG